MTAYLVALPIARFWLVIQHFLLQSERLLPFLSFDPPQLVLAPPSPPPIAVLPPNPRGDSSSVAHVHRFRPLHGRVVHRLSSGRVIENPFLQANQRWHFSEWSQTQPVNHLPPSCVVRALFPVPSYTQRLHESVLDSVKAAVPTDAPNAWQCSVQRALRYVFPPQCL